MNRVIANEVLTEGIDSLYEKLGPIKTIKFFQLIGASKGDSVSMLRKQRDKMNKKEILKLITETRKKKENLWRQINLL